MDSLQMKDKAKDIQLKQKLKYYPKADLHRHLEGAVRFSTFREFARKGLLSIEVPDSDNELIDMITMKNAPVKNLQIFLDKFIPLRSLFENPDHLERLTIEAIEDARQDGCCYLELRFSPGYICSACEIGTRQVVTRILDTIEKSNKKWDPIFRDASEKQLLSNELPIHTEAIMILSRQSAIADLDKMVSQVSDMLGTSIRGVDLAGDEANFPPQLFKGLFKSLAGVPGLSLTIHAGEIPVPENVNCAVETLGAARIGHGVHSVSSRYTMDLLKANNTVLEICPTSNVHTGVCSSLSRHPARALLDQGVAITFNSDDPGVSDIDLTNEYLAAMTEMGFRAPDMLKCLDKALEAAFADQDINNRIREWAISRAAMISL
ncbi:MAG: adenosine deaminase [Candidatus Wallbacteria bacterium HGW-Wallbacteria-1]|jgi:adenosine deaminase|uniref:adenosine deaminase n=1 Tax=Candidatus Wallbacteria bacterium HGW-Wallbacteria-1 TaxID=2013854 RepID=A0A2N1PQZ1_9BACT|nr:MAG: adenosine deaminase [Candidatus Wallbacteria bacterium HGW-Wallbacteria-1]